MTCPTCGDWGSLKVPLPNAGWFSTIPCPTCRPVEHQAALGGEQGDDATDIEMDRLRRRVAELEADVAALRGGGKAP